MPITKPFVDVADAARASNINVDTGNRPTFTCFRIVLAPQQLKEAVMEWRHRYRKSTQNSSSSTRGSTRASNTRGGWQTGWTRKHRPAKLSRREMAMQRVVNKQSISQMYHLSAAGPICIPLATVASRASKRLLIIPSMSIILSKLSDTIAAKFLSSGRGSGSAFGVSKTWVA